MEFMVLGHRGAMAYAPENTMKSFDLALSLGVNGIETDVQQTKDGYLVLLHDDSMVRYGDDRFVRDLTLAELQMMDLGEGERVVLLGDFLEKTANLDLFLAIELKQRHIHEGVADLIKKHIKNTDKTTITSFDFRNLEDTRNYDENIAIGWLTDLLTDVELNRLNTINANQICPKAENTTPENVRVAKECGFSVRAWGVDNEDRMFHCLDCVVDGMTINFPDKLISALAK